MASRKSVTYLAVAATAQEYVTPVNKVLELLNNMHTTAVSTMQEEEKVFASFTQKCADDKRIMEDMIAQEQEDIEKYAADISKAAADISTLTNELANLEMEKSFAQQDQKAATKVRQQEKTDFLATDADYEETLLALDKAVAVLRSKSVTKEAADFLQTSLQQGKSSSRVLLQAALGKFLQAPVEATTYAYETQMSGVIDMLLNLKEKFYNEKVGLNKDELTAKHHYDVLMETRSGEIDGFNQAIDRKTKLKGRRTSDKGFAEGAKADMEKAKAADTKELNEQNANCKLNIDTYTKQQALRSSEVDALSEAIKILGSETVKGSAETYLPGATATSFLQLEHRRRRTVSNADVLAKASRMLIEKAQLLNSPDLSMLATKVNANPLKKVTEMIRSLVSQLMQEATGEADQKAWCGVKLAENKVERETKEEEVEDLTAVKEKLSAKAAQLDESISHLGEEIAFLSQDRSTVEQERAASKKQNEKTILDAQQGAAAIAKAVSLLQEYYAKAKVEAGDLDQEALDAKSRAGAAVVYGGQQDKASGVLSVLEVIQSDFARLESETAAAETQAAELYEKFMNSSEVDLEVKKTEKKHKEDVRSKTADALDSTTDELTTTTEELAAANKVLQELKPVCIDTGMTYEQRVQRREAEIQSLKEVLEVLSSNESGAI